MNKQPKRGPGRPHKTEQKPRITITLSLETIHYLNKQPISRSEFIEQCITEHRERDARKEK